MNIQKIRKYLTIAGSMTMILLLGGCSRSAINYQIAESIGTLGVYENNEPVETPKMKTAREQRESEERKEQSLLNEIDKAKVLADGYYYTEALQLLEQLGQEDVEDERVVSLKEKIEADQKSLVAYTADIPHLCFPGLVEDTKRAFDDDYMAYNYSSTMLTTAEFKAILDSLYANDYILVNLHDAILLERDVRGVVTMERQELMIPKGKKPVILSQDNLTYEGVVNGDGVATRLTLDENGEVKALYTDEGGHDLKGDYDLIPILDTFIAEHPDFSLRGAKGIVSVSAENGMFGYPVKDTSVSNYSENRDIVAGICEQLKASGWSIACAGYSHSYLDEIGLDGLKNEIGKWKDEAGILTGPVDILFYPYGAEVAYPSEELDYLKDQGLVYLCGLWGDTDCTEIGDGYARQTRRFVDGYTLQNAPQYFNGFFQAQDVLDKDR